MPITNERPLTMEELLKPSALCPHPDLPANQRHAISDFKTALLAAFDVCQKIVGPATTLAVLIDDVEKKNLTVYQPLPEPRKSNRDPHALMGAALQHVAGLN